VIIKDILYGEFEVDEVIIELLNEPMVQRLALIHQAGACYLYDDCYFVSRLDHSLGVMLLIKKLGGSLEEQVAGLLHDISHTAFSHTIDFLLDNEKQDYHETIKEEVIYKSKIPEILLKYNMDVQAILDEKNWSLLEQDLPLLCCDRIDYTLRDQYHYFNADLNKIHQLVNDLKVIEGRIIIGNKDLAIYFKELFNEEVNVFFNSPLNIYLNQYFTDILKKSLDNNWISLDDFLLDDSSLLNKILDYMKISISEFKKQFKEEVDNLIINQSKISIIQKKRVIDPEFIEDGRIKKTSDL
jgi:HD superfamily phosphohydrolases